MVLKFSMRAPAFAAAVFLMVSGPASAAELFRIIPIEKMDPTPAFTSEFDNIRSSRAGTNFQIIDIDPNMMTENSLDFTFSPDVTVHAFRETGDPSFADQWVGSIKGEINDVILTQTGNAISGTIFSGNKVYQIEPMQNGLHVLYELDTSKLPQQEHPGESEGVFPPANEQTDQEAPDLPPGNQKSAISVLVAYTPAVKAVRPNIQSFINQAMTESNTAVANSGVNARLSLAHSMQVPFVENKTYQYYLSALKKKNDGVLDEVHAPRDQYKADIVVLLVTDPKYCGYATVHASQNSAFAVVNQNCATGYFSLVHEIGHNLGNLHNPEVSSANWPYKFGHGFIAPERGERSVMAYDSEKCCIRRPQFSRPTNWGDTGKRHNARVWNLRAAVVAGFR